MKSRQLLLAIMAIILFYSCGDPVRNQFGKVSDKAATVEVYINKKSYLHEFLKNTYQEGKPLFTFPNDSNAVAKLLEFVSNDTTPQYKCTSHGYFRFLDNEKQELFKLEFNFNPKCRHFGFSLDDKPNFRKMTDDGVKYLSSMLNPDSLEQ